jgi:class 3 adenylate cyclase
LEYAAIGSVTNLASRLCDEAKAGQIVVARRVYGAVEQWVDAKPIDDLVLKGFNHPVLAMEIVRWREEVPPPPDGEGRRGAKEKDVISSSRTSEPLAAPAGPRVRAAR